jgi:putative zinc finger/helix-turn-helix YgiT family protein
MLNSIFSHPAAETCGCPSCGEATAIIKYESESFPYGVGKDQVMLNAMVPVIHCDSCGGQFTNGAAEEIRHAEVCRHLGRLTPLQIKKIREQHGLSQQDWSKKTKLGIASVKRWESGNLIQSEAMDCYLRLLENPLTLARVASMNSMPIKSDNVRFQTELPPGASEAALSFELRKAS